MKCLEIMKQVAEECLPKRIAVKDKRGITDKLYNLIIQRGQALLRGDLEGIKNIDKQIQKQKRYEKREYHKQITREELDVREFNMGIRKIKTDYSILTYHFFLGCFLRGHK